MYIFSKVKSAVNIKCKKYDTVAFSINVYLLIVVLVVCFTFLYMTQIGSKESESGASNESIPYTSSPVRLKLMLILQRKEKPWNLELIVGSILKSSPMKMDLVKPNASIVQKLMQLLHHLMVRHQ